MAVTKEHKEFFPVDFDDGWATPPGYPDGIEEKILAGAAPACCASSPASIPPFPSCMSIGRKSIWYRAI